jgi:DNA polymerase IV
MRLTNSVTVATPTTAADIERAVVVLGRFEHTRPVRLVGVRAKFQRSDP